MTITTQALPFIPLTTITTPATTITTTTYYYYYYQYFLPIPPPFCSKILCQLLHSGFTGIVGTTGQTSIGYGTTHTGNEGDATTITTWEE